MIGIDTNVHIRLFVDDVERSQVRAARGLILASREDIRISIIVLVEAFWTLRRRFGLDRQGLIQFLDAMLSHPGFVIEARAAVEAAAKAYEESGLDFADGLIAASNAEAGASTTFTFDVAAARRGPFTLLTA